MKKKGKRIIGYCRESTATQFNEGFNIDDQEKRIRSYFDIYYSSEDSLDILKDAASAKSLDRMYMNEAIERMRQGEVNVFIVYSLDRMTRRVKDLAYMLDIFQKNDVQLLSISEKIDTKSAMGRFFIYLIVLIAQWEQDTIASRTERGVLESAMQGNYAKPGYPIGYIRNPEDTHKLIVDPETADVVKYVFNEIAENSLPMSTVMHRLNASNALNKTWSGSYLSKIVNNKIYYGTMELKGKEFPNIAPPLITKETYDLAQLKVKTKSRVRSGQLKFKSYVRCTGCNKILFTRIVTLKNKTSFNYYVCSKCGSQISEIAIMKSVNDDFTSIVRQRKFEMDIKKLEKTCADTAEITQSLPLSYFLYGVDKDYVAKLISEKNEDKDTLEENIGRLEAGLQDIQFRELSYSQIRDFLSTYVEVINVDLKTKGVSVAYKTDTMAAS